MGSFILGLSVISLLYVQVSGSVGPFVTTVKKITDPVLIRDIYGISPNHAENFVIPDGQCSGLIDRSFLCFNQDAGAVQVEVKDNVAFPRVRMDNSLQNATIQRSKGPDGRCVGNVEVQLSFYCFQNQAPVRQRRSMRLLPPVPEH